MRRIVFILSVLCAILSGWTSALGQAQQLGSPSHARHAGVDHKHANQQIIKGVTHCDQAVEQCKRNERANHPMLCAACYAIPVEDAVLKRNEIDNVRIAPALQAHLTDRRLKPQFPPPKPFLSV